MNLFSNIAPFNPVQDRLGLGLQYVGSKEMIAPKLINAMYPHIPNAKYAFDLFGGGGAMSFAFVKSGLITTYNELKSDMCLMYSYVLDCINNPRNEWGIFDRDLYEFCDRAEHKRICEAFNAKQNLTPQELIKRYTYSFNCQGTAYFKGDFKEKFAKAGHIMVMSPYLHGDYKSAMQVYSDYFGNELGNDIRIIEKFFLEFCENSDFTRLNLYDRRKVFSRFVINLEALCIAQILGNFKGFNLKSFVNYPKVELCAMIDKLKPDLPKKEYKKPRKVKGLSECRALSRCQQLQQLQRLQQLERLQRLQRLQQLQQLERLSISNKDYLDFDFVKIAKDLNATPEQILIYCDIPYQCSKEINDEVYHNKFDINQFVEWAKNHATKGFKIFLSELETPAPQVFREIYSTQKGRKIGKLDIIIEKLFLAHKD